jgi:hypothetical protein
MVHGWFWRNRTENPVTVTLNIEGHFSEMKKGLLICKIPDEG